MSDNLNAKPEIVSENTREPENLQNMIPSNWVRSSARFLDLHLPALIIWYLLAFLTPDVYQYLANNKLMGLQEFLWV